MRVNVYRANRFLLNGELECFRLGNDGLWIVLNKCVNSSSEGLKTPQQCILIDHLHTVRPYGEITKAIKLIPEPEEKPWDVDPEQMVVAGVLTITTPQQIEMKEEENNEKVK